MNALNTNPLPFGGFNRQPVIEISNGGNTVRYDGREYQLAGYSASPDGRLVNITLRLVDDDLV